MDTIKPTNQNQEGEHKRTEGEPPISLVQSTTNEDQKTQFPNQYAAITKNFPWAKIWGSLRWFLRKIWHYLKKPSFTDWIVGIATVVIAFYAVLQHVDSKYAGTQTDRIIAADVRIATAMENTLSASSRALDATITQNQLDQRAWVGANGVTSIKVATGEISTFSVVAVNSGKTPALHVRVYMTGRSILANEKITFTYPPLPGMQSNATIQPGGKLESNGRSASALTQKQVDAVKSGTTVLYVYGKLTYEDVFQRTHITTFCAVVNRGLNGWEWCDIGNNED